MYKKFVLTVFLLLPVHLCLAEITIHLRNGKAIVAQKVKVSDHLLLVVENGVLRRIPFAEVSEESLREQGIEESKIAAANNAVAVTRNSEPSGIWQPREASEDLSVKKINQSGRTDAKLESKPSAPKPAKRDEATVTKINHLCEMLDSKYKLFAEDCKTLYPNPDQAVQVTASMAIDHEKLVNLITTLKQGMARQIWEGLVTTNLGINAKAQQTVLADGRLVYYASKSLYRKEKFILAIQYGKDGSLLNWDCEIRVQ